MKRVLYFFVTLCIILTTGCAGKGLSKKEAAEIIKKEYGYPEATMWSLSIPYNSALGEEIRRQIDDGYLTPPDDAGNMKITDKGRLWYGSCSYDRVANVYLLKANLFNKELKEVDEVMNDNANGVAKVMYTVSLKPTDLYRKFREIDKEAFAINEKLDKAAKAMEVVMTTRLKKWDDGWRVEENGNAR